MMSHPFRSMLRWGVLEAGTKITVFETFELASRASSALAGILACGEARWPNERGSWSRHG